MKEGAKTGTQQVVALARIAELKQNKNYQLQELKIKQAELSRQLDKEQFDKEMKQSEHGLVVADNLSNRLDSMDPTMRAVTLESPSIKAVTDGLKKTNPELFDDKGAYVGRSVKSRAETQIENTRNQAIGNIQMLTQKAQANGGVLSPEDKQALQSNALVAKITHNSNMGDLSKFIESHYNATPHGNDTDYGTIAGDFLKKLGGKILGIQQPNQPTQNPVAPALAAGNPPMAPQAPVASQGGGTQGQADPNDPLGLRKGA